MFIILKKKNIILYIFIYLMNILLYLKKKNIFVILIFFINVEYQKKINIG